MNRKEQLEENISKSYYLLAEYEKKLICEDDPKKKMKYENEIDTCKKKNDTFEKELEKIESKNNEKLKQLRKKQSLNLRVDLEINCFNEPIRCKVSFFNSGDFNHYIKRFFLELQNMEEKGHKRWIRPELKMPVEIGLQSDKSLDVVFKPIQDDINKVFYLKIVGQFIRGSFAYRLFIEFLDKKGDLNSKTINLAMIPVYIKLKLPTISIEKYPP